MRVLHIGLSCVYGGVEAFVMTCLRRTAGQEMIFDFVDLYGDGIACSDEILAAGGQIHTLCHYKRHPVAAARQLTRIIRSGTYSAVHIHMLSAANMLPLLACRAAGVKPILHAHNTRTDGLLRNVCHSLGLPLLRRMDAVRLACCGEAGRWLYGKRAFQVIPNAIEVENYGFDAAQRRQLRSELGIGEAVTVLGFVGRLMPAKNPLFLLTLLEALKKEKNGRYCLLILGDGKLERKMHHRIRSRGLEQDVIFAGVRRDVGRWLAAMDVFLLPSRFEGLSISAVEAQCSGLSCLVSDRVTPTLAITDRVRFLPIRGGVRPWVQGVLQAAKVSVDRADYGRQLGESIYSVYHGARMLWRVYRHAGGEVPLKLETLIVTVDQRDHSLVDRMNIQTDTVVGNQCGRDSLEEFTCRGYAVRYLNSSARGVGRNRNAVLERSHGDICILADDDMRFVDGYPAIMEQAVAAAPDADVWLFNLIKEKKDGFEQTDVMRIGYHNYQRYGASRIALRRSSIQQAGIWFDLRFGGGSRYSAGEDTLFLKACLDHGLKIMAVPLCLARMDQSAPSTWFRGYHDKFFFDKGALYQALHPSLAPLLSLRFAVKYRKDYRGECTPGGALAQMLRGVRAFACREDTEAGRENRVGIMSFPNTASHGAILQMYALYHAVRELGFDARIIHYNNVYMRKEKHTAAAGLRRVLRRLLHSRMYRDFRRFEAQLRHEPKRPIRGKGALLALGSRYDRVICGSDQVWNPKITGGDISFFLDFCDQRTRRIAYAPSFGVETLEGAFAAEAGTELSKFAALSVREEQGRSLVAQLSGRDAALVLDPVFLLPADRWETLLEQPQRKRPYVLYYDLRGSDTLWEFCRDLAGKKNLQILVVGGNLLKERRCRNAEVAYAADLGPARWLGLLHGAEYVVTNSFHGTAFSIHFRKNFYVEFSSCFNSRLEQLTGMLGLQPQVVREGRCCNDGPVDYSCADRVLPGLTESSRQYLKEALGQVCV